ncbi:MAG: kinase [Magnetococcus sp. YQC-9]
MIITRTPFRISFFGGGTDYPTWFREHGGAVLSTTIDKYCHISLRTLPPFFEHKHRIVYSKVELVRQIEEIQHPVVREGMRWFEVQEGLEIHHDADLPARSGLGSSSAFSVGFLHALHAHHGRAVSKRRLAQEAIELEHDRIGEHVGIQDQISTSFGGLNRILFSPNGEFQVEPVVLPQERFEELDAALMLVFTGQTRLASEVAKQKIDNLKNRSAELHEMRVMVDEGLAILQDSRQPIDLFGALLDRSWRLKRRLSGVVTNSRIDEIYEAALDAGASGGKLMGAGAGGFMIFIVRPALRNRVAQRLKELIQVKCRIEQAGTRLLVYDPDHAS